MRTDPQRPNSSDEISKTNHGPVISVSSSKLYDEGTSSPDFETDSCIKRKEEVLYDSIELSSEFEIEPPKDKNKKCKLDHPESISLSDDNNRTDSNKAPRMLFTPFPSSSKCDTSKNSGIVVNVTQKKTQKGSGNFAEHIESKVLTQIEDSEFFSCDTQMLRDIERKELGGHSNNSMPKPTSTAKNEDSECFPCDTQMLRDIERKQPRDHSKTYIQRPTNVATEKSLPNNRSYLDNDCPHNVERNISHNGGFKTASGNKIDAPSEHQITKMKNTLLEDNAYNHQMLPDENYISGDNFDDLAKKTIFPLHIKLDASSKGAIAKANKSNSAKSDNTSKCDSTGFMTASGNKMKGPSLETIKRVQSLWNEPEYNSIICSSDKPQMDPETESSKSDSTSKCISKGFMTGSGSKIQGPSLEAIRKIQSLWHEPEHDSTNNNPVNIEIESSKADSTSKCVSTGFLTASGSKMKSPSLQAIKKFQSFWDEPEHKIAEPNPINIGIAPTKSDSTFKCASMGLMTASGSKLKDPSVEATNKVKLLWNESEHNSTTPHPVNFEIESSKSDGGSKCVASLGLMTASGSKMKGPSVEAMQKVHPLWNEPEYNSTLPCPGKPNCHTPASKDNHVRSTKKTEVSNDLSNEKNDSTIDSARPSVNIKSHCNENISLPTSALPIISPKLQKENGESSNVYNKDFTGYLAKDISEILKIFTSSPDIETKLLLPNANMWICNHYRWITWKLISRKRFNKSPLVLDSCSRAEILSQLRLRYNREIERSERSALKKIYEGDSSPSQGIVLCVARIEQITENGVLGGGTYILLELTDGWYSIACVFLPDNPLIKYINGDEKITVGTKLITFGAELENLGQPCSPLEAVTFETIVDNLEKYNLTLVNPSEASNLKETKSSRVTPSFQQIISKFPMLKVHPNSTRRVRLNTKMGFHHSSPTMAMPFSAILNNGGHVSEVWLEIVREYPLVYKEASKNTDASKGATCRPNFINEKAYDKKILSQNRNRDKVIEEIYIEVQKEFDLKECKENKEKQRITRETKKGNGKITQLRFSEKEIKSLCSGEEINDIMEKSIDPASIESLLSLEQYQMLCEFKQVQRDELGMQMKAEVQKRINERLSSNRSSDFSPKGTRDSTNKSNDSTNCSYIPILRLRVADLHPNAKRGSSCVCTGTIQIWRPTEEMLRNLKENKRLRFINLIANIVRDGEVQFRATKATRFEEISESYLARKHITIMACQKESKSSAITNLDIKSFKRKLTHIDELISSPKFDPEFREVDLIGIVVQIEPIVECFETVYICDTSLNMVAVKFWKGIQEFGYEGLFCDSKSKTAIKSPGGDFECSSTILYLRNLQWRPHGSQQFTVQSINLQLPGHKSGECTEILLPSLFVTEQTVITKNPREAEQSRVFADIKAEIGQGLEGIKLIEQAKMRLGEILTSPRCKPRKSSMNQETLSSTRFHSNETYNMISPKTPAVQKHAKSKFRVPYASPSTPLTSRSNIDWDQEFNIEKSLVKGNVEIVSGSPAEDQSKKTKSKIAALEKASIKLSYWNP